MSAKREFSADESRDFKRYVMGMQGNQRGWGWFEAGVRDELEAFLCGYEDDPRTIEDEITKYLKTDKSFRQLYDAFRRAQRKKKHNENKGKNSIQFTMSRKSHHFLRMHAEANGDDMKTTMDHYTAIINTLCPAHCEMTLANLRILAKEIKESSDLLRGNK
ncbi:MAG: hypothetical protein OQK12_07065 [Motiliproteus sp.]|nr:hypothetical protein [Motiliproteus sp.]MCW9052341.1 hypothetical protein [Motiliproteus sp.]